MLIRGKYYHKIWILLLIIFLNVNENTKYWHILINFVIQSRTKLKGDCFECNSKYFNINYLIVFNIQYVYVKDFS